MPVAKSVQVYDLTSVQQKVDWVVPPGDLQVVNIRAGRLNNPLSPRVLPLKSRTAVFGDTVSTLKARHMVLVTSGATGSGVVAVPGYIASVRHVVCAGPVVEVRGLGEDYVLASADTFGTTNARDKSLMVPHPPDIDKDHVWTREDLAILKNVPTPTGWDLWDYMLDSFEGREKSLVGLTVAFYDCVETVVKTGRVSFVGGGKAVVSGCTCLPTNSGGLVLVDINGHPLVLGVLSQAGVSTVGVVLLDKAALSAAGFDPTREPQSSVIGGPGVPDKWSVSPDVKRDRAIWTDDLRGCFVGVHVNRRVTEPVYTYVDPHLPEDVLGSVYLTRAEKRLVFADPEKIGVNPVGETDSGRPVFFYDGDVSARAGLRVRAPPERAASLDMVRMWARGYAAIIVDACGAANIRDAFETPLTFEEAAFGVPGKIASMNTAASAGPTLGGLAADYIDLATRRVDPRLKELSGAFYDAWDQGVQTCSPIQVSMKPEVRPLGKNPRDIFVLDLAYNLALKRVFGKLAYLVLSHPRKTGLFGGVNAASRAFGQLMAQLHKPGGGLVDGDESTMDMRQNPVTWYLLRQFLVALCHLSKATARAERRVVTAGTSSSFGLVSVGGSVLYTPLGMCSGTFVTALFTSFLQALVNYGAVNWPLMTGSNPGIMSPESWAALVFMAVVGDDSIVKVHDVLIGLGVRPKHFSLAAAMIGLKMTDSAKKPLGDQFSDVSEVRFLKRSLALSLRRPGCVKASLPVESVLKALVFKEKAALAGGGAVCATLANAWKETHLMEGVEQDQARSALTPLVEDLRSRGFQVDLMGDEEFRASYARDTFVTYDSA